MALGNIGSGIAKKILVSIDVMTDQAQNKLKNFERQARRSATSVSKSVTGQVGAAQSQLDQFGVSARGVGNASENAATQVRGINDRIATFGKDAKFASDMANTFRMDMLSVMFAGMQLMAVFGGMITQMLKFTGASDALGAAMKSVLLPVTMLLQPILIQISEFLMNLDRGSKMILGLTVLVLGLAGVIAFAGAQIVMLSGAISGMTIAGTAVATILGAAISVVLGFAAGFITVVEVVQKFGVKIGAVIATVIAVVGAAIAIIASSPAIVAGAIALAIGAIIGFIWAARDEIVSAITGAMNFIKKALVGGFKKHIRAVKRMFNGLKTFFSGIGDILGGNFIEGLEKVIEGSKDVILGAINSLLPLGLTVDGIASAAGDVGGAVGDAINVNDAVITPGGKVIKTAPDDFLFATKNPGDLAGGGGGPVTINIDAEVASDIDMRDLADEIQSRLDRSTGGRSNIGNRGV